MAIRVKKKPVRIASATVAAWYEQIRMEIRMLEGMDVLQMPARRLIACSSRFIGQSKRLFEDGDIFMAREKMLAGITTAFAAAALHYPHPSLEPESILSPPNDQ